jgi:hypothetical protein
VNAQCHCTDLSDIYMIGVEKGEIYALELLIAELKFVHRHLNFGRVSAILHVTKWKRVVNGL